MKRILFVNCPEHYVIWPYNNEKFMDAELTINGQIQATKLTNWLQQRYPKIKEVYSSEEESAMQVAKIIARELQSSSRIHLGLKERVFGTGDIHSKFIKKLRIESNVNRDHKLDDGESLIESFARFDSAVEELLGDNGEGSTCIIIAHNDVLLDYLRTKNFTDLSQAVDNHILNMVESSVSAIEYTPNNFDFRYFDCTMHLN